MIKAINERMQEAATKATTAEDINGGEHDDKEDEEAEKWKIKMQMHVYGTAPTELKIKSERGEKRNPASH